MPRADCWRSYKLRSGGGGSLQPMTASGREFKSATFSELDLILPHRQSGLPADDSAQSRAFHAAVPLRGSGMSTSHYLKPKIVQRSVLCPGCVKTVLVA